MRRTGLLVVAVTVLVLTLWAGPASAEWFLDAYFGGAFTFINDLDSKFGSTVQFLDDVEYDASFLVGGRVGYWFDRPLGGKDRKSTRLNSSHLGISYAV